MLKPLRKRHYLFNAEAEVLSNLAVRRLSPEPITQISAGPANLVERVMRMHRQADQTRFIRDGTSYTLHYPPICIGRKLRALLRLVHFNGTHKPAAALLNKVCEIYATVYVLLRYADNKAHIACDKPIERSVALIDEILQSISGRRVTATRIKGSLCISAGRNSARQLLMFLGTQQWITLCLFKEQLDAVIVK